ncbi:pyruvate:ferredoxin (flavodoxin) oxidoreductase [Puniceicoccus vermicola]|uniref:Pyruvate:ferredoxin (Flavodoxin) oxidoreductase n=1 Tax=Puniceicoccus vermicola TaxID=388746 RepID=A0A7X1E317_9BACT|nr:pyruvate:ferredoxin (flavodoxin) oxidoreductase [Puniceicoccus vermicola]MBC2600499.1 pyruvate:ferredoxin (flavodoxin) oxidoreductase [Puniceicoccus vermicola]
MIAPAKSARKTMDANEAVASVAYRFSEVVSMFPITPSTPMAEHCDEWSAAGKTNLWGDVPRLVEMQSEGGAAGALHGSLMGGALGTTFTASQGLLLMIPNLYKLAGELTPTVVHVSARAIATHALSIFGDHSDVMACRATGLGMLASNSVQEAHDFAAIAHAATLRSRLPFIHFFDGFRTSHELSDIELIPDDVLHQLVDPEGLEGFYKRGLTPDAPSVRGTAQNPDTYFQGREAVNPFYREAVWIVAELMERFGRLTGRKYAPFEYEGHPEADEVIVIMGSGAETVAETARFLNETTGSKRGVLKVRLYRPFHTPLFLKALPKSVKRIAVLDRTKEPGGVGEPLYLDVSMALSKAGKCEGNVELDIERLIGGRYGLGSKEFTPEMVAAVFQELEAPSVGDHFTVGIKDDVTGKSLDVEKPLTIESSETTRALFFGLGSDGTVGANKNTIKIIGDKTGLHTQGYFVYDSKKSGGLTVSHLRFGPDPIRAPYLISDAKFVGCHQPQFLGRVDMLGKAQKGATFLVNSTVSHEGLWDSLPRDVQRQIIEKEIRLFHVDALSLAADLGMGNRTNTIMQACFFALSDLLPPKEAVQAMKDAITKTYSRKGPKVVEANHAAVDAAIGGLERIAVPADASATDIPVEWVPDDAPDFVRRVTARLMAGEGDLLPVSAFPVDGSWPTGTSRFEKRNIAREIPIWQPDACTQCNKCAVVCPHSAVRPKIYNPESLEGAPETFRHTPFKGVGGDGLELTLQVYPEDCTGCTACVEVCPATAEDGLKAIRMVSAVNQIEPEKENLAFFEKLSTETIPDDKLSARTISFRQPLFEFSGACAGCTQTPYVRMLTQLYGDRLLVANATGCSSIYGGNLPTTPYCTDENGRGPAWANSLFEDNAEFGLGLHMAAEWRRDVALRLLTKLRGQVGSILAGEILDHADRSPAGLSLQRSKVDALKEVLAEIPGEDAKRLILHADYLVPKSTWIVGGDGWAYDIDFGGLDHVLASGYNVNILVLDTEIYSNTGGQASKATPVGAQAKFAAAGKELPKKDLAAIAMSYGGIYVAQIALGANEKQTLDALREAESYDGPSLVIAYGPCAGHGIDLRNGPARQKAAVETGYWPLFRFDPRNKEKGRPILSLDSFEPSGTVGSFMEAENRFKALRRGDPERADSLTAIAQKHADERWKRLEALASVSEDEDDDDDDGWG